MAFDWTACLNLARELAQRNDDAAQRSAISRAYYTAFGRAREFLLQEGWILSQDAQVHSLVWQEFVDAADGVRHYVGIDGMSARRLRNQADYDAEVRELPKLTQLALRKAEQVLTGLDRLGTAQQSAPRPPTT